MERIEARYHSWIVVPMRIYDRERAQALFVNEKAELDLSDVTYEVRSMFDASDNAIGDCRRLPARTFAALFSSGDRPENEVFTVRSDNMGSGEAEFSFCMSYLFFFKPDIVLLCLGVRWSDPLTVDILCDFGFLRGRAEVVFPAERILLSGRIEGWAKDMGLKTFYTESTRSGSLFFSDACIYQTAFCARRFSDIAVLKKYTKNLHMGIPLDDPGDDASEEDVAYSVGVKNFDMDEDGRKTVPGTDRGTYRWGCCVTCQTLNCVYGGVDPAKITDREIEETAMEGEGLPLLAIAMQQKYRCFELVEKVDGFTRLSGEEMDRLKSDMRDFIAYGTVSPSMYSRWYNLKSIYAHLIAFMGIREGIDDVTRKLNMLISDSEKQAMKKNERANSVITGFGLVAIPVSLIEFVDYVTGKANVPIRVVTVSGTVFVAAYFIYKERDTVLEWGRRLLRRIGKVRSALTGRVRERIDKHTARKR